MKRWRWFIVGVALLLLGTWLASQSELERHSRPVVSLPRAFTAEDRARSRARQEWLEPIDAGPLAEAEPGPEQRPQWYDPMYGALPPKVERVALVVEVNAVFNSPLGNKLTACLLSTSPETRALLAGLNDAGFNPLAQLDRLLLADKLVGLSGDFSHIDLPRLLGSSNEQSYGRESKLFTRPGKNGEVETVGLWKQQYLVLAVNTAEVTAALDRLERRETPAEPSIRPQDAYGELYGTLNAQAFAKVFSDRPELAEALRAGASTIRVHGDVSSDLGLVADITGTDPVKADELRKALGSALAIARARAAAGGAKTGAALLDQTRVHSVNGADFRLEAGVPYELLAERLDECINGKPLFPERAQSPAPAAP